MMIKTLLMTASVALVSNIAFASDIQSRQVGNLVEFGNIQQGSILIAQNRQDSRQLQAQLQLPVNATQQAVVLTGATALQVRNQMVQSGHHVGQFVTSGPNSALVFTDSSAATFLGLMRHHYGTSLIHGHSGIVIIKGGLYGLAQLTGQALYGTVRVGVSLAHLAATFTAVAPLAIIHTGAMLMHSHGTLLVKTLNTNYCVMPFAIGGIANFAHSLAPGVLLVAQPAIFSVFEIVGGITRAISGAFSTLFQPIGYNRYQIFVANY